MGRLGTVGYGGVEEPPGQRGAGSGSLSAALPLLPLPAIALFLFPIPGSGQALPFHTSTAITAGFDENAARHFVGFVGRSGLARNGEAVPDPAEREVEGLVVVNGAILGGFTPLWTFRLVVPWVRKEMEFDAGGGRRASFENSGLGDPALQTKWVFYRDDRPGATTRVGVRGRVKAPVGRTDARLPSGEIAPRPLQAGTGTWDFEPALVVTDVERRVGVHGNLGWTFRGRDEAFDAGDAFLYDVAVGFRLVPESYESMRDRTVVAYLELNGEVARRNELRGRRDPDSGGHVLHLSPALQWVVTPRLLFEGSVQLPVVQDLNGVQLERDARFHLGTRYRFSVFR